MSKIQKQTFLQGALILGATNLLVKIIGATFKIPLRRLIGPEGMGIFTQAYSIYLTLFIIATAGMPVAISKMVSESIAKGKPKEAQRIFKVAFYLLNIIGIVGTTVLIFGAKHFSVLLRDPQVYLAILAVSPSLLFVAIMSAYRGYFQGLQNMIPTAVSEVVEVLGKLIIGYFLASLWLSRGLEYSAAGAVLGVSTGTLFGAIILFIIYQFSSKNKSVDLNGYQSNNIKSKTMKQILFELVRIAIPITIGASVFTLTNTIDTLMVKYRLQTIGFTVEQSRTLYGYYGNDAITLFNLPPTLIVALSISIVPAIAKALAVNNKKLARFTTESAIRITVLFALPCAIGLSILADPILKFVYNDGGAANLLSILGIAVVFVSLVLVSNAILQATGKVMIPVRNMFIGGLVKVVANYILVGQPQININGAPIGTTLCYFVIAVLNLIAIKRIINVRYSVVDFIIKPIVAVASMAISVLFTYNKIIAYTRSNSISTLGAILVGVAIYGLMLLAIGAIKKEDIEMLPKGQQILKILNRFGLLK